jgi:hypothetical protein
LNTFGNKFNLYIVFVMQDDGTDDEAETSSDAEEVLYEQPVQLTSIPWHGVAIPPSVESIPEEARQKSNLI